jgi:hypothetical protein
MTCVFLATGCLYIPRSQNSKHVEGIAIVDVRDGEFQFILSGPFRKEAIALADDAGRRFYTLQFEKDASELRTRTYEGNLVAASKLGAFQTDWGIWYKREYTLSSQADRIAHYSYGSRSINVFDVPSLTDTVLLVGVPDIAGIRWVSDRELVFVSFLPLAGSKKPTNPELQEAVVRVSVPEGKPEVLYRGARISVVSPVAWSADCRKVAFFEETVAFTGGKKRKAVEKVIMTIVDLQTREVLRVDTDSCISWAAWSPDGEYVGYVSGLADLTLYSIRDKESRFVTKLPAAIILGLAFLDKERIVVDPYGEKWGLLIVDITTGKCRYVFVHNACWDFMPIDGGKRILADVSLKEDQIPPDRTVR